MRTLIRMGRLPWPGASCSSFCEKSWYRGIPTVTSAIPQRVNSHGAGLMSRDGRPCMPVRRPVMANVCPRRVLPRPRVRASKQDACPQAEGEMGGTSGGHLRGEGKRGGRGVPASQGGRQDGQGCSKAGPRCFSRRERKPASGTKSSQQSLVRGGQHNPRSGPPGDVGMRMRRRSCASMARDDRTTCHDLLRAAGLASRTVAHKK
jgi:hypothetical protein